MRNHLGLTFAEVRILAQAARGLSVSESAEESSLAFETVKSHRRNIFAKLDVTSIAHAVAKAYEMGVLHPVSTEASLTLQVVIDGVEYVPRELTR